MEKAGVKCGRQWVRTVKGSSELKGTQRDHDVHAAASMQAPEAIQVNKHRPQIREGGAPQELALGHQSVCVSVST